MKNFGEIKAKLISFREFLLRVVSLLLLGGGLFWIAHNRSEAPQLTDNIFFQMTFRVALGLFLVLIVINIREVMSKHVLKRYDKNEPDSLVELQNNRKFDLAPNLALALRHGQQSLIPGVFAYLADRQWIFDRELPTAWQYFKAQPLNAIRSQKKYYRFLVAKNTRLKSGDLERDLHNWKQFLMNQASSMPSNVLVYIAQGADAVTATKLGVPVANHFSRYKDMELYLILIEPDHGKVYFPNDTTFLPLLSRLRYTFIRKRLLSELADYVLLSGGSMSGGSGTGAFRADGVRSAGSRSGAPGDGRRESQRRYSGEPPQGSSRSPY